MIGTKKMVLRTLSLTAAAVAYATGASAADFSLGDLKIEHPVVRATPPNAPVSAGYMIITNSGDRDDRLLSVTTAASPMTEIHEMAMDGEIMRMRELDDGLAIPAGQTIELKPGGFHLMMMQLPKGLVEGDEITGSLTFEEAGRLDVVFNVQKISPKKMGHGHMKKDNGN